MKFLIGRSPECALVINHACVSSKHASIHRDSRGVPLLVDESSANGTFLNQPGNEIQTAELHDDDLVLLSHEYKVPGGLLLKKFTAWEESGGQARGALAMGQVHRFTMDKIALGSAPSNQMILPYLDIWPEHAVISRQPDGTYSVTDFGGGCVVSGRKIEGGSAPLQPNDTLELGGVVVSISYDPAGKAITIGAERSGFYLTAKGVTFTIGQGAGTRNLVDRVGFSVMPGEFVGLMGPSGCGKTTLLTCLSGVNSVPGVYYNGELFASNSSCGNVIGYVPQEDVLYPELTVRETLFYSARLRLSSRTSSARIHDKIDEVCAMLGLVDTRTGLDLRNTQIGSPERKTLSGGQKKRVNLALELLTDPLVLFLDEPTSGLSSQDTRIVMERLRQLADEKGIPIIITIHQPSLRVYKLLDQTLYLKSGKLAWFGPGHPDSIRHFVKNSPDTAGPDEVMEAVDEEDAEALRARYEQGRYAQKFVRQREELITALTLGGDLAVPKPVTPLHLVGQFSLLLNRQLKRRWRDLVSFAIQLGQAPLLGLMVGFAFREDRINSPLFLLSFIAIWFGTNATARELVSERVIFKREKRGGVSPAATLLAKLANHGLMLLAQCLLLLISAHSIIGFDMALWQGVSILWLCGLCGAAIGFVISALAKSEIAATAATPLVLIPLILFGGYLTPYDSMPDSIRAISQAMPSRWGYEALVQAEMMHHKERAFELNDPTYKGFAEFCKPTKGGRFEKADRPFRIWACLAVLAAGTLALSLAAWHLLRTLRG